MKYNKWTVALAALGVVSFASAAKAEEKASPVMTALSSTTISGYVDTSAEWNVGKGNDNFAPYKFNSMNKADGFNLDVIQLRIDKPLDEQDWAAGYRADLWFGPDANTLRTTSGFNHNTSDFGIRQAYVALRVPVGKGLDFKMGVFDSIIGYESIESGNNPNFTRSYGHSIEPQTETGLLASYRLCDCFSVSAGVADTVGPAINDRAFAPYGRGMRAYGNETYPESFKTWMGSVALTAPDSMGFLSGSTLYGGIVNGFGTAKANHAVYGGTMTSYYVGATVATPVTGLRAGTSFDFLDIHNAKNDTYSVAGYLSYQATEKLSFHARGEYFKDKGIETIRNVDDGTGTITTVEHYNGVLFNNVGDKGKAEVLAVTATIQYDLWKNVISRLELRWDHSLLGNQLFGGTTQGVPELKNAFMLGANVIYKF
jgi:Putative beta-barrel porin-2, OmpL-like. bbp2